MAPCVTWIHKPYGSQWFPPHPWKPTSIPPDVFTEPGEEDIPSSLQPAKKNSQQKNKKTSNGEKHLRSSKFMPRPRKMMPTYRTQNGANFGCFDWNSLGLCFGSGGSSLQKLEVITVGFLAIVQHHQLKGWEGEIHHPLQGLENW